MAVQIATATANSNSFLGGGGQRRIAFLCDGTLAVLFHNGSAWTLLQVTNPGTANPTVVTVTGYPGQSTTSSAPDMQVINGVNSSELWFSDTQANVAVVHATYTPGGPGWSWTPRTFIAASSQAAFWSQITWTGTYLVELHQDSSGGVFSIWGNYTADRTGTSGWQAAQFQLGSSGSSSRIPKPLLLHDAGMGATVAIYCQGTSQPVGIYSRVLPDALTPALAHWGPETSLALSVNLTLGSQLDDDDGQSALIDPATKRIHYAYCDSTSGAPRSPGYLTGTVTVDPVTPLNNVATWSAPVTVDTDASATMASLAVNGSGTVFLYWCTEPTGISGDVKAATISSPYQSVSAATNLTNRLSDNNQGSHVPQQVISSGVVPAVYVIGTTANGSAPPWKLMLDTSVTADGTLPQPPPGPPPQPPPQPPPATGAPFLLVTSANSAALALGSQRRVATLADGSLAVLDFDGTDTHLYQVGSPGGSSPTTTSVRQFANMNSFYSLPDLFVCNNADGTTDLWIADTTTVASITHGLYTSATRTWTWDATQVIPGSSTGAYYINLVWTGTRLIVAYNDGSPYALYYNWTADKTGASGWSPEGSKQLSNATHVVVRPAPVLVHDARLGATVCIYFIATQLISRVLNDATSPLFANWGPETNFLVANVEAGVNHGFAYFNNHSAVIDPRTGTLHYGFCDAGSGPASPGYMKGTVSADPATPSNNHVVWSPPVGIGPPSRNASSPAIGVDSSSTVHLFWATTTNSTTSDVLYATLQSPYSSAGSISNVTNNAAGNNFQPHIPRAEAISGYVPLVYLSAGTSAWGTSSPWAVVFDNTFATSSRTSKDVPGRFKMTVPQAARQDVHARFNLLVPGTASGSDKAARFAFAARSQRDVRARFAIGSPGRTTLFNSSSNQALTLPSQRRVGTLCDGSLAVLGWDGAQERLFRVTNPRGPTPTVTGVQALAALNSFYALPDLLIVNNGTTSSDVWIADSTSVAAVQHATYSAVSQSWTWDARTNIPGSSNNAFYVQLAWTGSNLICAYQDGSHAVYLNYTNVKNGTSGWQPAQVQLSSAGSANVRPVIVLLHEAALAATVALYSINSQVISRVLADSALPGLANWGAEVSVVNANVGSSSIGGYAYAANLTAVVDPATKLIHVAYGDGGSGTRSPGYLSGTASVDGANPPNSRVAWGAPVTVGTPSSSNSGPAIGVDRASTVFVFWAGSTGTSAADIKYSKLVSPYTAAAPESNFTTNAGGNYTQPHIPRSEVLAGYVPVVFESGAANPYKVLLDASLTAG